MNGGVTTIWLDESGDCGFKFERGSSRFLVIVGMYARGNADDMVHAIEKFKIRYGLNTSFEFKFSRCRDVLKRECLELIAQLPLEYKAIVVDKKELKAPALQYHPHELYCEAVRRLLYDNNPPLAQATLILDEAIAKIHHKEFSGMLKRYVSKTLVQKIRQVRSRSTPMVQISDMIAGRIFREYEKGDHRWHQIVKGKEMILVTF